MSVEHVNIATPYIHETKGVALATTGQILTANSGAGLWDFPYFVLTCHVENISVAGSNYVVSPYSGIIIAGYSVIKNAITVANNTVTLKIATVAVTNGVITITQAGSAAGDVDSCSPTALNLVNTGEAIEIAYTGSTTTCQMEYTLLMKRTA